MGTGVGFDGPVADGRDYFAPGRGEREPVQFRLQFAQRPLVDGRLRLVVALERGEDVPFALPAVGVVGLVLSPALVVCHSKLLVL